MIRKLFCSMFVMVVAVAFVAAEDFNGRITKVDGDKVTFQKTKKGKKGGGGTDDGDPVTYNAAGAKVNNAKFGKDDNGKFKMEAGDEVEKGLKNEMFSKDKIGEKGVNARITVEGDKVTQILIMGGKGKKGGTN